MNKTKPYVLRVAEIVYTEISNIKKKSPEIKNIEAIERFIGTKLYNQISSGEFHENWLSELKKNNFVDKKTDKKVSNETLRLLQIQKEIMKKQLIIYPDLYYTKSHYPLEISQRAFDQLWRICESYELWCKETDQNDLVYLNVSN